MTSSRAGTKASPSRTAAGSDQRQLPPVAFTHRCLLRVRRFERAQLSLAALQSIPAKLCSRRGLKLAGRLPVESHVKWLVASCRGVGTPISSAAPLLVVSCRNVLANLRCGASIKNVTPGFLTVNGEDSLKAQRPYHVLACRRGGLFIEEFLPARDDLSKHDWLISGVPVLWDGERIMPRMLPEVSDLSHVFHIPRGGHAEANERTARLWGELFDLCFRLLDAPREVAWRRMRQATRGLPRERDYLHNILGIGPEGELLLLIANGKLEDLGRTLAREGASRAIMVDNGGSCAAFYYPEGWAGRQVQLVGAPYYRPPGTAYLVFELEA